MSKPSPDGGADAPKKPSLAWRIATSKPALLGYFGAICFGFGVAAGENNMASDTWQGVKNAVRDVRSGTADGLHKAGDAVAPK